MLDASSGTVVGAVVVVDDGSVVVGDGVGSSGDSVEASSPVAVGHAVVASDEGSGDGLLDGSTVGGAFTSCAALSLAARNVMMMMTMMILGQAVILIVMRKKKAGEAAKGVRVADQSIYLR